MARRLASLRFAFSLVEVLVVLAIIGICAALTYPVFTQVKRNARKAQCLHNLHQIGVAMALYRDQNGGADAGTPDEMGLPNGVSWPSIFPNLRCQEHSPKGFGYTILYPEPGSSEARLKSWTAYTQSQGGLSVFMYDDAHQSHFPISFSWENWTVLAVRLDTSVFVRTRMGVPSGYWWWTQ